MHEILITIRGKLPVITGCEKAITAGRDDYTVRFQFDEQWDDGEKQVYFVRSGNREYATVQTAGDTAAVPIQTNVKRFDYLIIGVRQGDIRTSRPCSIPLYAQKDGEFKNIRREEENARNLNSNT